jgi:signal transduction histidine kinase/ActR/RegA family two-component response regulator
MVEAKTPPDATAGRVLILAPIGRDAAACAEILRRAELDSLICPDMETLVAALTEGADAALIAEEGLVGQQDTLLGSWVERQPPWSDMPFIVVTTRQAGPEFAAWRHRLMATLRNASMLPRPLDAATLASAVAAAVRGRQRQYEARAYIAERAAASGRLEDIVAERTAELRREIAERAAAEDALRQAQKMEAVGQLTGGLAHDFNNLLAGISGSLELLAIRLAQGRYQETDKYMVAARGAVTRAASLTHRLLAFSRRQTLDPKPTDVNRLVTLMAELVRRTVGPAIDVEVACAAGLLSALVDPNQLENALLNLCINARDAMPDGGRIAVQTANTWLDRRAADALELAPGQFITLSVTDTGCGMTPDIMARAFDPFFTTKPQGEGTGLGLSMIYGFARQSGGQVRITSAPGKGTTVCIYLPRHYGPTKPQENPTLSNKRPRAAQGESVLLVEDEPTMRMVVTEVLKELGYDAIEVGNGAAALDVLRSDARVDLLVTDVGLPGGMNGRQVADAGRTLRPGMKVLFITGYAETAVVTNGQLEPGMHVLTKPFAVDSLVTVIRDLIVDARAPAAE